MRVRTFLFFFLEFTNNYREKNCVAVRKEKPRPIFLINEDAKSSLIR